MTKPIYHTPIGLLGGTFDPIHNGHLEIASIAQEFCHLKNVRFIPNYQPVHRAQPTTPLNDRVKMIELALAEHPSFKLDRREIKREGPSYTIDTLISLRTEFPDTPLCLILGQDAFLYLHHWHRWNEIIDFAHIIIISRETYSDKIPDELLALLKKHQTNDAHALQSHLAGKIFQVLSSPIPISASHIRYQLQRHLPPNHDLPESVYEYILEHHLYQEPS